eukprot:c47395_g1_i1 orf=642-1010(+)
MKRSAPLRVTHGFNHSAPKMPRHPDQFVSCSPLTAAFSDEWCRKNFQISGCLSTKVWPDLSDPGLAQSGGENFLEVEEPFTSQREEYAYQDTPSSRGPSGGMPVYVMLPLDSLKLNNTLNRP